jgi:hypothetical protein
MTETAGAAGVAKGAAMPLPGELLHPFTVWVTVYVPAVLTVMEVVVSPVLHNNAPVNPVAVKTELPQLLATITPGVDTEEFNGAAIPFPGKLVHPFTVCVTV